MQHKTIDAPQATRHAQETRLSGNMGVGELVMNVLAFSSPLATVAGTLPPFS